MTAMITCVIKKSSYARCRMIKTLVSTMITAATVATAHHIYYCIVSDVAYEPVFLYSTSARIEWSKVWIRNSRAIYR